MTRAGRLVAAAFFLASQLGCSQPVSDPGRAAEPSARSSVATAPGPSALSRTQPSWPRPASSEPVSPAPGESMGEASETGAKDGTAGADPFTRASSVAVDAAPDIVGDPAPPYAEIVRASVRGRGDTATFVLEVDGPIPRRVGDRDNVLAGIGIEYQGRMGGIALIVQGTRDGWLPGIQREGEQRELKEGWKISGNRFVWTVPWREVGGPRQFRWGASLRWFRFGSSDPDDTEQSRDRVPDVEPAVYPATG